MKKLVVLIVVILVLSVVSPVFASATKTLDDPTLLEEMSQEEKDAEIVSLVNRTMIGDNLFSAVSPFYWKENIYEIERLFLDNASEEYQNFVEKGLGRVKVLVAVDSKTNWVLDKNLYYADLKTSTLKRLMLLADTDEEKAALKKEYEEALVEVGSVLEANKLKLARNDMGGLLDAKASATKAELQKTLDVTNRSIEIINSHTDEDWAAMSMSGRANLKHTAERNKIEKPRLESYIKYAPEKITPTSSRKPHLKRYILAERDFINKGVKALNGSELAIAKANLKRAVEILEILYGEKVAVGLVEREVEIGQKIADVLHTDIVTEINGQEVESFNINGLTAIYVKEAKKLGYTVNWDENNRLVSIINNEAVKPSYIEKKLMKNENNNYEIGEIINKALHTDIQTSINGDTVESFNINGSTAIFVNAFRKIPGITVNWDLEQRKVIVYSERFKDLEKEKRDNEVKVDDTSKETSVILDATQLNYTNNNGVIEITAYTGDSRDIIIPSKIDGLPVTSIGESAFSGKRLTSVTIPNTVTYLGNYAFEGNPISSFKIPKSVTHIGDYTFHSNVITSIEIPDSVTYIGAGAFSTNSLTSVEIGNSVIYIGDGAFYLNSSSLTSITIPDSVTIIGDNAFSSNGLKSVKIPNSVTSVGNWAFRSNDLTSVTIGNSVTSIGSKAFEKNNLTSVEIPDSVTFIGESAFKSNELTSVTLGNSLTSIEDSTFNSNKLTSLIIPNSISEIGEYAFYSNILKSVEIPNSVKNISVGAFRYNNITEVKIPINCSYESYSFDDDVDKIQE